MFLGSLVTKNTDAVLSWSTPTLTEAQVAAVEMALDSGWSVDRHESTEKSLTLLVSPPGSSDQDVAFYVEADGAAFILSEIRNDELKAHGCFGSVETLVSAMRSLH